VIDYRGQVPDAPEGAPANRLLGDYVEGVTHDYVRHGTLTLFAALDIASGKVLTKSITPAARSLSSTAAQATRARPRCSWPFSGSSYTYAEATWTQGTADWIGSHVRAFEYFSGVPALVVSDNLRTGVSRACRWEPGINATYAEMLTHYGSAALPARVGRPQDKAKVESAVQVVQRWILARLRHRTFFSLAELNAAIRELLEDLNSRRFRKLPGSRRSQYDGLDRPALLPLPAERYELAEWRKVRPNLDYPVKDEGHYYSVPSQLCGVEIEARVTARIVECFHKGRRVASHVRSSERGRHTTAQEHMPRGPELPQPGFDPEMRARPCR